MAVNLGDGTPLGSIVHSFGCYAPIYKILDSKGVDVMKVKGKYCGDCCITERICGKGTEFMVTKMSSKNEEVGKILKHYAELQESLQKTIFISNYDDVDACEAEFPKDMNIELKALFLSAVFLINFMYFDEEGPNIDVADHEAEFLFREDSGEIQMTAQKPE